MAENEPFSITKLLTGPFNWRNYLKLGIYIVCGLMVFSLVTTVLNLFAPQTSGAKSVIKIAKGATVGEIHTEQNGGRKMQGIYLRGASDRVAVGVFKEMGNNIEIAIGGGKDFDEDAFLEVEARYKF